MHEGDQFETGAPSFRIGSRFATLEETLSPEFTAIVKTLDAITVRHQLPDHADVNKERYPWSAYLLSSPSFYAARMWEYPYAILSADLKAGMRCADVGCGMTAFTIYLKDVAHCHVTGVDPDIFASGIRYKGHGVSREYLSKTGLTVVQCGLQSIGLASDTFDRVFCLSVIEHLEPQVVRQGARELARILKPGGRAIFTVDVNLLSEVSRPLDLIWDSGLLPDGELNLQWPKRRLGIFNDKKQPADVYGLILKKDPYRVETQYSGVGGSSAARLIEGCSIPQARQEFTESQVTAAGLRNQRPLWRKLGGRIKRAIYILISDRMNG